MRIKKRLTYELYRLQQKIAITRQEMYALLCLVGFILLGTVVQAIQRNHPRFDPAIYAETDSLFEAATLAMRREEHDSSTTEAIQSLLSGGVVNINTASKEALETLPRIGPAMADRIIAYRSSEGPFGSVDELVAVKGIGPKTLEKLRDRVTVE